MVSISPYELEPLSKVSENTVGSSQDIAAFYNNLKPVLDQSFTSFEEIEIFLDYFSRFNGFSVVLLRSQKIFDIVMQATFGCYRSGKYRCRVSNGVTPNINNTSQLSIQSHKSVKTDCPWRVNIRYSTKSSKFVITKVILEHNHELSLTFSNNRILYNRPDNVNIITDKLQERSIENNPLRLNTFADIILLNQSSSNIKKPRRSRNRPFQAIFPISFPISAAHSSIKTQVLKEPKDCADNALLKTTRSIQIGDDSFIDSYQNPSFGFSFEDHSEFDNISQTISHDLSAVLRFSMPLFKETDS